MKNNTFTSLIRMFIMTMLPVYVVFVLFFFQQINSVRDDVRHQVEETARAKDTLLSESLDNIYQQQLHLSENKLLKRLAYGLFESDYHRIDMVNQLYERLIEIKSSNQMVEEISIGQISKARLSWSQEQTLVLGMSQWKKWQNLELEQ